MANQKPLRFNPSTGGFKLFQGDDNFWLDYTNGSGNIVDIQKSTATLFSIGNKGETQIDVAASAAKAALTVGGRPTGGYPYLVLKDLALGEESLRFSSIAYSSKPSPVLESQAADGGGFCFRMVANLNLDTPTLQPLLSVGHTKTDTTYQEAFRVGTDGRVHLTKTTGADLIWTTNGGGNIGESGGSKPANVYALTTVNAAGTVIKTNALDLGPQAATDKTITALQTGTNDPKFQYKVGVGWQFTNDGTTWIPLIGASTITWDTVYDNSSSGLSVDTAAKPFAIAQTLDTAGSALTISRAVTPNDYTNPLVKLTKSGNDWNYAFQIDNGGTSFSWWGIGVRNTHASSMGVLVDAIGSNNDVLQYALYKNGDGNPRWLLYAGGYMALTNVVTTSHAISVTHPTNATSDALYASGPIQVNATSTISNRVGNSTTLTRSGALGAGTFCKAGYFSVQAGGVADSTTAYYIGADIAFTANSSTAQSYGLRVEPDYRVGSFYSSTVFDQWTDIDRSAIVIDTASYATADSYGIVFTSSASAQRPSNLYGAGSTAILVNSSWTYGLYSLSTNYTKPALGTGGGYANFSTSTAPSALSASQTRTMFYAQPVGHATDDIGSYTVGFYADGDQSMPGTGRSYALYVNADWYTGVYSLAPENLFQTNGATGTVAVHASSDASTALAGGQSRTGVLVEILPNAGDVGTSNSYSFKAVGSNGTGNHYAYHCDDGFDYGVYSLTKSYIKPSGLGNANALEITNTATAIGSGWRTLLDLSPVSHASDTGGFTAGIFLDGAGTASGSSTTYGIFASGFDYSMVSAARVLVEVDTGVALDLLRVDYLTDGALSSGEQRRCNLANIVTFTGDNANSRSVAYEAATAATNQGSGLLAGFYANANFDYGVYSLSSKNMFQTTGANGTIAVQVASDASASLAGGQSRTGVLVELLAHGSDAGTSNTYSFSAIGANGTGNHYAYYCDDGFDYGVYSLTKSLARHTNAGGFGGSLTNSYAITASAVSSATGLVSGDVFRCFNATFTPLNAVSGTPFYVGFYSTGSATAVTGAGKVGFHATADHDYGVWSLSRTITNYTAATTSDDYNAHEVRITSNGSSGSPRVRIATKSQAITAGTPAAGLYHIGTSSYVTNTAAMAATSYAIGYQSMIEPNAADAADLTYIGYIASINSTNPSAGRIAYQVDSQYGVDDNTSWSIKSAGGRALFQQTTNNTWSAPLAYDLVSSIITSGGETNASDLFAAVRGTIIPSNSDTNNSRFASLAAECSGTSTGTSTYYGLYVSDAGSSTANMTKTGVRVYKWPATQFAVHIAGEGSGEGGKVGIYQNWGTLGASATHVDITDAVTVDTATELLSCVKISANGSITAVGGNASIRGLDILHTRSVSDTSNGLRYGIYEDVDASAGGSAVTYAQFISSNWNYGVVSTGDQNIFSRADTVLTSSTYPVLKVQQLNTATSTAHAIHAKIAKVTDGQYAVALENTAESSTTAGTKHHIGFFSAKTNRRNFPLHWAVPNGTDYSYNTGSGYWVVAASTDINKFLEMPLMLPNGSTVTTVLVTARPGGARTLTDRSYIGLYKNSFGSAVFTLIGSLTYDDGTDTFQTYTISGLTEVIDNTDVRYFVRFRNIINGAASTSAYVRSYRADYTIQDLGNAPGY